MKKLISLFFVFSILTLSMPLTSKEKKGAELIIQKTNGSKVEGELIAVKENSLLLKLSYSSFDVSTNIAEVKIVTIIKKPKTELGALVGFLTGGSIGALLACTSKGWGGGTTRAIAVTGVLYGLFGAIIGGGIGGGIRGDKTIIFEGKSDSEIQEILEKLREKARVKNAR